MPRALFAALFSQPETTVGKDSCFQTSGQGRRPFILLQACVSGNCRTAWGFFSKYSAADLGPFVQSPECVCACTWLCAKSFGVVQGCWLDPATGLATGHWGGGGDAVGSLPLTSVCVLLPPEAQSCPRPVCNLTRRLVSGLRLCLPAVVPEGTAALLGNPSPAPLPGLSASLHD